MTAPDPDPAAACACLPDMACGGTGDVDPGEIGYCPFCLALDVYDNCPAEESSDD